MIGKELSKITQEDLQNLIDNVVLEGKTIEYKAALPGNSDGDKREFLADVSSFANAGGGDLIFGMTEDPATKEPKSLDGLDITTTVDQEKARLDNMIREGVEPRMPAVHIHPVSLKNGKTAIVIRVGKSWVSPHRVTYKGHDEFYARRKFYARNSSGKYPLDVGELRTAFTMSETITERIRRFREERIARLYANETPVPFNNNPKTVLHLTPINAFSPGQRIDMDIIARRYSEMKPIYSRGVTPRFTLEGLLNYDAQRDGKAQAYVHLHQNGIVEAVDGFILEKDGVKLIDGLRFEQWIVPALENYIHIYEMLKVDTPVIVFLTMINANGFNMRYTPVQGAHFDDTVMDAHPIDRDVIILPEVMIEDYSVRASSILKPIFDSLWNACGWERSPYYKTDGKRLNET